MSEEGAVEIYCEHEGNCGMLKIMEKYTCRTQNITEFLFCLDRKLLCWLKLSAKRVTFRRLNGSDGNVTVAFGRLGQHRKITQDSSIRTYNGAKHRQSNRTL